MTSGIGGKISAFFKPGGSLAAAERQIERGDAAKGATLLRKLAEAGDPEAQFRLAGLYEKGRGVVQSFVDATRWFRAAAEQGDLRAQSKLGEIYYQGRTAPRVVTAAAA